MTLKLDYTSATKYFCDIKHKRFIRMNRPHTDIANFFIAGINYKKSDASMRGQFSINGEQYLQVILAASEFNIKEFFVLSTCNRTEIYGFAENADALSKLLCTQTEGSLQDFNKII
jgi:glutamyl-tRNA reductase